MGGESIFFGALTLPTLKEFILLLGLTQLLDTPFWILLILIIPLANKKLQYIYAVTRHTHIYTYIFIKIFIKSHQLTHYKMLQENLWVYMDECTHMGIIF